MARIGILVVAYNAAGTLHEVLDRIPVDFRQRVDSVLVSDDASHDATYLVGVGYRELNEDLPLTVIRHEENLGYGGNQKAGYRWAIDHGLDIVVLLHGDGQYAPELLPEMVAPLEAGEAQAVFGSRMLDSGAARKGGMPLYKYMGNRILTRFENSVAGADLSEWHSGYRAYSTAALAQIPFEENSDGFDFDTEVIVQLLESGQAIAEIPIPTYYGDEISHVNGMRYAADISQHVVRYRAHKMGFGSGDLAFASQQYEEKAAPDASHALVAGMVRRSGARRVLDLGCAGGAVLASVRSEGVEVVGVDLVATPDAVGSVDRFIEADLSNGIPAEVGDSFDAIVCADVLEHLAEPAAILEEAGALLSPGGRLIASIPNFAHWYVRARVALGRFDYERRGILDQGHLRFFTRRSFTRLAENSGWTVRAVTPTGLPLEVLERGGADSGRVRLLVRRFDALGVDLWPTLFGYQFVFELARPPIRPHRGPEELTRPSRGDGASPRPG